MWSYNHFVNSLVGINTKMIILFNNSYLSYYRPVNNITAKRHISIAQGSMYSNFSDKNLTDYGYSLKTSKPRIAHFSYYKE